MKLSTITWIAFFIIAGYWLTNLAESYYQAIYAYQDMRNSQIAQMLK